MSSAEWGGLALQGVVAIAAAVTAIAAWRAQSTWRQQVHGRADYEVALRLLMTAIGLAKALRGVMNSSLFTGDEIPESVRLKIASLPQDQQDGQRHAAVINLRWQRVAEAESQIRADLLFAQAQWGWSETGPFEDLLKLVDDVESWTVRQARLAINEHDASVANTLHRSLLAIEARLVGDENGSVPAAVTRRAQAALLQIREGLKDHLPPSSTSTHKSRKPRPR